MDGLATSAFQHFRHQSNLEFKKKEDGSAVEFKI
jgi:hypothetical protein